MKVLNLKMANKNLYYMQKAVELAERGRGRTSPNPMVGAVIVKNNSSGVGEGFHARAGESHAEINALRAAGGNAKGATLYTTLEPCCIFGKTPPCTEAIILSGISKVLVGLIDPNPKVNGKGVSILKKAGITVESGFLAEQIARQNEVYLKHITTGKPFVLMKVAMSLDGKIAAGNGSGTGSGKEPRNVSANAPASANAAAPASAPVRASTNGRKWITGTKSRELVHKIRDEYDAVAVGIGTVFADDPLLTARLGAKQTKNPVRIVIDSKGRLPLRSQIVKTAPAVPTILATTSKIPPTKAEALNKAGIEVLILPAKDNRVNLKELLKKLGAKGITSILVEGGAGLNSSFLKDNLVDKFLFFVAPKIFGSSGLSLTGRKTFEGKSAANLKIASVEKVGEDLAITCYQSAIKAND